MKINQNKRIIIFITMVVLGLFTIFILSSVLEDGRAKNLLLDYKNWDSADSALGYFSIQNIMWVVFFIGLGELLFRILEVLETGKGIHKHYLPEDNHTILEPQDMPDIYKKLGLDVDIMGSLAHLIKKMIMQFQATNSVEQTNTMLNSQLELQSAAIDTNYNMIRYITWFIPTLGFIGTVLGISQALGYAGATNGQGDKFVAELTDKLALAFDTTLLALIMSAILVFIMHLVQGKEEKNLVVIGQYTLDNFVNRLVK